MEVGTFDCQRRDCPRTKNPDCSLCGMPTLTPGIAATLNLYNQCKNWRTLPFSGGVLDQPASVMEDFSAIDAEAADVAKKEQERSEIEQQNQELLRRLHQGR